MQVCDVGTSEIILQHSLGITRIRSTNFGKKIEMNMFLLVKNILTQYTLKNIWRSKALTSPTCDPSSPDYAANAACVPGLCGRTFYPEEKLTFGSPRSLFVIPDNDDYYHVQGVERNHAFKEEQYSERILIMMEYQRSRLN